MLRVPSSRIPSKSANIPYPGFQDYLLGGGGGHLGDLLKRFDISGGGGGVVRHV